ncbi:hypothetical protein AURANDRAFT_10241, partial [Aureococcus anophagefferens]
VELRVEGMTCAACASRVAKALRSLGVDDISVNCVTDQAGYASSPDTARVEAEGEKAASDDPHVAKTTLATKGMICPSCPPRIQRALKRLDGVRDVTVFLVLDAVEVLYDARIVGPRLLAHRLSQLGYDASVQADDDGVDVAGEERARKLARVAEVRAFRRRAAVAFALAAPVFVVMMLVIPYGARDAALGSLLLATPVQFVLGFRFYVGAFNSLRYGTANMDVLVALGTSAAYFYSIYVLYECSDGGGGHGHHGSHADDADCVSGHHFFETSSVLIAFVLLGKFMEAKAKGRTSEALQALLSLQPKMATVSHTMDDGGDYEEVVDAGSLSRGDVVKIKPGEAVPADGAVVSGESNCDESMLTGESMPGGSEHPLASALVATAAEARGRRGWRGPRFRVVAFDALVGRGVSAALRRADDAAAPELVLHVGTRDLVAAAGGGRGALGPERDARAKALEADGATVVFVHAAVGGRRLVADDFKATAKKPPPAGSGDVVGMIGVADIIRDEAARVVSHLQSNLGIEVWMLTGDNERTAQAIARQCGISRVLAKVRPDDKARNVTSLMDQGHVVAMVGDGVNDSPALAAADLGVAIGAGAQIAVETADVVLIRSVLDDVATAIEVSRATFGRIKANLFFSLAFNGLGIPIAAGALYPFLEVRLPPEVAALAMVLSSVSVVASSLSLRSYK